jgi:multidrug efflux system membrane fusion protein
VKRAAMVGLVVVLAAGSGIYLWQQQGTGTPDETQRSAQAEGRGRSSGARRPDGPASVLTAPARYADVPVTLVAVGTAQALQTVMVRPQVGGRLMELSFREGQEVRKGDVLAHIDPTIYQAQHEQALAKKAQTEAQLGNARLDLARSTALVASNYVSRQQADTQRANVAQLEAQLKSDQAAIDNTKAYLDYTTIMAPIDGRTGIRLIDQGNVLSASDPAGLVVITQLRPITVLFNLAQQHLRAVNAAAAAGSVPVEALDADNQTVLDRGRLEVVDNQVDQTTGTVKLKATFPNETQQLWPGQFVNVRLTLDTIRNAVVVPSAAVQRGPNGAFVYGVADDRAVLKKVEVGRQDETSSVILSGLTPPERVVTTGFARLTNGDRVRVVDAEQPSEAAAPVPAAPTRFNEERRPEAGAARGDRPEGDRPRRRRQEGQAAAGSASPARTE